MKFRTAMLCNHAEVRDSMLYIHGGAPEWWTIADVPAQSWLTAAVVIEDAPTTDEELEIFVWVHPADVKPEPDRARRAAVVPIRDPNNFVAGAPRYTNLVLKLGCEFDRVGGWQVTFFADRAVVASIAFGVRLG